MKQILLLLLLNAFLINCFSQAPPAQLHLRKNGRVKKRMDAGIRVSITDNSGKQYYGPISYMKTDTLFINGFEVPVRSIRRFRIVHRRDRQPMDWNLFGYASLGVLLSTAGMTLSKWETLPSALGISAVLGYSPFLIQKLRRISFKKYRYRIGGRFTLRVWDLR